MIGEAPQHERQGIRAPERYSRQHEADIRSRDGVQKGVEEVRPPLQSPAKGMAVLLSAVPLRQPSARASHTSGDIFRGHSHVRCSIVSGEYSMGMERAAV